MIREDLCLGETFCTYAIRNFPQDQSFPDHGSRRRATRPTYPICRARCGNPRNRGGCGTYPSASDTGRSSLYFVIAWDGRDGCTSPAFASCDSTASTIDSASTWKNRRGGGRGGGE